MWASVNCHLDVVSLLLEAGADVNLQNNDEDTSLTHASRNDDLDVVSKLLEAGADVNLQDNEGERRH